MDEQTYQSHAKNRFQDITGLPRQELESLLQYHQKHIEFHGQERKMHFGALALVAVLLFLLLPIFNAGGPLFLYATIVAGLLLVLVIPYVWVYYRYENTLRRMNEDYFKILDAKNGVPE